MLSPKKKKKKLKKTTQQLAAVLWFYCCGFYILCVAPYSHVFNSSKLRILYVIIETEALHRTLPVLFFYVALWLFVSRGEKKVMTMTHSLSYFLKMAENLQIKVQCS